MFELKQQFNYKYFFFPLLILFVGSCVFNVIQRQLYEEHIQELNYSARLASSVPEIKMGITPEEVIKIVELPPDETVITDGETIFRWSAVYHVGALTKFIYQPNAVGSYWLIVRFDRNGKAAKVSANAE